MSKDAIIITLLSLNLIGTGATITFLVVGAKKVEEQVEETKSKGLDGLKNFRDFLNNLEL